MFMGNLDAKRDWGHAKDYVESMWLILQAPKADDWVVSTGITTSVRDFITKAFGVLDVKVRFEGEGLSEKGIIDSVPDHFTQLKEGQVFLKIDPHYFRPTEVDLLIGDSSKIRTELGWSPKYNLDAIVREMVQNDMTEVKKEMHLKDKGFRIKNNFEM